MFIFNFESNKFLVWPRIFFFLNCNRGKCSWKIVRSKYSQHCTFNNHWDFFSEGIFSGDVCKTSKQQFKHRSGKQNSSRAEKTIPKRRKCGEHSQAPAAAAVATELKCLRVSVFVHCYMSSLDVGVSFSLKCEFENCVLLFKCTACWCVIQLCHFWVACSFIWAHTTAANTTIELWKRARERESEGERTAAVLSGSSSWNFGTISLCVCESHAYSLFQQYSPHLHTHAAHDLQ